MPHPFGYTTKKKRLIKERSKSLEWAKPLIEKRQRELEEAEIKSDKPQEEPHMLHLVHLVKELRGRPWWEKEIAEKLHLDGKVCRNMPENL